MIDKVGRMWAFMKEFEAFEGFDGELGWDDEKEGRRNGWWRQGSDNFSRRKRDGEVKIACIRE